MSEPESIPNSHATLGLAFGVAAILPGFGLFLGLAAFILGRMGLRRVQDDPAVPGKGQSIAAMILGAVWFTANCGLVYSVVRTVIERTQ